MKRDLLRPALLYLFLLLWEACATREELPVSLIWHEDRAIGVSISTSLLPDQEIDSIPGYLSMQVRGSELPTAILGEVLADYDRIIFTPAVPFTRGLTYGVFYKDELIEEFMVPESDAPAPELLSIYPTQDTVPENLLKIYLRFSRPMTEGRSLSFITVLKDGRDTLQNTFLDLQPELWNTKGTVLTLWLDPGRIKRDLIPNREQGTPLQAGGSYTLQVSTKWKSKDGVPLVSEFSKAVFVASRDEESPRPEQWTIVAPKGGTADALRIQLKEPLDYSLLMDAISIMTVENVLITGDGHLQNEERIFDFVPDDPWKSGEYVLKIEVRLEDLAGNNLNRAFDRDITHDLPSRASAGEKKNDREVVELKFQVN